MTGLTQTLELGYVVGVVTAFRWRLQRGKSQCLGRRRKFFSPATSMFGKSGDRGKRKSFEMSPRSDTDEPSDGRIGRRFQLGTFPPLLRCCMALRSVAVFCSSNYVFFCSFVATVFFFAFFIYSVRVQLCWWEFRSRGRPEFQCGSEVFLSLAGGN